MMAAALLAGCAARPAAAPEPAPVARPEPAPVEAATAPQPSAQDWADRPLTAGDWSYAGDAGGSAARFAPAGFSLRCEPAARRIAIGREGASGTLRLRTSYGERLLPPGATVPADDPLLDEIAFSRGRFAVEADGAEALTLPAWPEPARVIEDCR